MLDFSQERKEAKVAKTKRQPKFDTEIKPVPIPHSIEHLEYSHMIYPIGFGYSEKGNILMWTFDHSENVDEPTIIEHLISPQNLQRIIEIAQETLDNLGRHTIGVKSK